MTTIRVLVVDDHPPIRALFHMLSTQELDLTVVGDTGDGTEAVRLARELRPDVVVLDLVLPGCNGASIVRAVRRVSPRTRIMVYTGYASDRPAQAALKLGVDGYVVKSASLAELIAALRRVHRGEQYVDPDVAEWASGDTSPIDDGSLTPRELDVLRLVVEGRRDREIAERLGTTVHTVHTHLKHLFVKLHATNRTELARRAERRKVPL